MFSVCTEEKKESNEVNKSMCAWMRTSVQKRNECTTHMSHEGRREDGGWRMEDGERADIN